MKNQIAQREKHGIYLFKHKLYNSAWITRVRDDGKGHIGYVYISPDKVSASSEINISCTWSGAFCRTASEAESNLYARAIAGEEGIMSLSDAEKVLVNSLLMHKFETDEKSTNEPIHNYDLI
jgi:hypothetical protein